MHNQPNMVELTIENETDTLGCLLQQYFLEQDADVYFSAYHRTHPLQKQITFVFETFPDVVPETTVVQVIDSLLNTLNDINTSFHHAVSSSS